MSREFTYYFHYCNNLKFDDSNYNSLKGIFAELLNPRINNLKELVYDWSDEENVDREKKRIIYFE